MKNPSPQIRILGQKFIKFLRCFFGKLKTPKIHSRLTDLQIGELSSKRPTTTVTAQFIQEPTGKKIIGIKGIKNDNFSKDQIEHIKNYVSERMLKARSEATLHGKVPPTEISIQLPNSLLPNSQLPKSRLPNPQMPKSERENMVVTFYNIPFNFREAYALFFKGMGIQVSPQSLKDNPRITHVIARAHFDASINTNFGAIVSGVWILDASYVQACMEANTILTNFSDFENLEIWKIFQTVKISEDLETLVGSKEATDYFVATQMRTYIKKNNLIDPTNRQLVICDDKLEKITGRKEIKCCDMIKYLRPHMSNIPEFSM